MLLFFWLITIITSFFTLSFLCTYHWFFHTLSLQGYIPTVYSKAHPPVHWFSLAISFLEPFSISCKPDASCRAGHSLPPRLCTLLHSPLGLDTWRHDVCDMCIILSWFISFFWWGVCSCISIRKWAWTIRFLRSCIPGIILILQLFFEYTMYIKIYVFDIFPYVYKYSNHNFEFLCCCFWGPFPSISCFLFTYVDWSLSFTLDTLKCLMTLGYLFIFKNEVLKCCSEALCAWNCQLMVFVGLGGLDHLIRRNYKCHIYRTFLLGRLKLQQ